MRAKSPSGRAKGTLSTLVAGVIAVGLAALNWHLLERPIDISPLVGRDSGNVAHGDRRSKRIESTPPELAHDYPQTLSRPLFFADRRPVKPKIQSAEKPKPRPKPKKAAPRNLPEGLELVGIIKGHDEAARALVRSKAAPTGSWVKKGHVLEGWAIREINGSNIVISAGSQRQTLSLFPDKSE